jgi:hypothetical protein
MIRHFKHYSGQNMTFKTIFRTNKLCLTDKGPVFIFIYNCDRRQLDSGVADSGPGSRTEKKSRSGMNIPDHISESLVKKFWGKKFLNSLMRIRDPGYFDPGSGIEKFRSGTRDKHPRSATLLDSLRKNVHFKNSGFWRQCCLH